MNEDIPPTSPSDAAGPAEPAAPAESENLLAVALAKGSNDSFPVLSAFQTFLDQERERARRRVVVMAACFTGAMIVLLLVFGILFATIFSRMMVRNEQQQDRLLDLVARGIPAAVHEAGYASSADPSEGVSRREVLELLQQMSATRAGAQPAVQGAGAQPLPAGLSPVPSAAPQGVRAPTTVIPSAVIPYGSQDAAGVAVPVSPARDDLLANPPPRTGVISSPFRQVQQAKEAREDAERRARLAAVREAEAQAAAAAQPAPVAPVPARDDLAVAPAAAARDDLAEGSAPVAAPAPVAPAASSAPTGPLPFALPAGAAPAVPVESVPLDAVQLAAAAAAPAAVPSAPAAERPDDGRRSISVKPKRRMEIPEGFSADRTEVRTESGSEIPFRILVPVPGAAR